MPIQPLDHDFEHFRLFGLVVDLAIQITPQFQCGILVRFAQQLGEVFAFAGGARCQCSSAGMTQPLLS